jgi:hypothetical protein
MPLTRGQTVAYDASLMLFRFTMMTPDARIIECAISNAAMDLIGGSKGTFPAERQAQFLMLRDKIEPIASTIFENEESPSIRIFAKHVGRRKRRR